jgi:hypothetical protein
MLVSSPGEGHLFPIERRKTFTAEMQIEGQTSTEFLRWKGRRGRQGNGASPHFSRG